MADLMSWILGIGLFLIILSIYMSGYYEIRCQSASVWDYAKFYYRRGYWIAFGLVLCLAEIAVYLIVQNIHISNAASF